MTIFYFSLIRSLRHVSNIILFSLLPLLMIFLPTNEWSFLPLGYQFFGVVLLFSAAKLVHLIMEDRINRTLIRVAVAPVTNFQYLSQSLLAFIVILVGQTLLFIIGAALVHGGTIASSALFFITYTFFSFSALGFTLAWCSLFRNKEASFTIMFGFIILMSMIGGLFWPVQIMPELLQRLAMLLPTYWLAEAQTLIGAGARIMDLMTPLAIFVLFTLSFLFIGSRVKVT